MTNSPFRRIVLPALLASSSRFVLLTWPLASRHAEQRAVPHPEATHAWGLTAIHNAIPLNLDDHPDSGLTPLSAWLSTPTTVKPDSLPQPLTPQPTAVLDWASLLQRAATDQAAMVLAPSTAAQPTSLKNHRTHHIQGPDHQHCLAVQVEGQDYSYYRRRPTLAKAQAPVQRLHRQGPAAITTHDQAGYVVWVHPVEAPQSQPPRVPVTDWLDPA